MARISFLVKHGSCEVVCPHCTLCCCKETSQTAWEYRGTNMLIWLSTFVLTVKHASLEKNTGFYILFLCRIEYMSWNFSVMYILLHSTFVTTKFLQNFQHKFYGIWLQKYCKWTLFAQQKSFFWLSGLYMRDITHLGYESHLAVELKWQNTPLICLTYLLHGTESFLRS